jgi:hypothetical protein
MNDGQMRETRFAWRVGFWNIRHLDKALALLGCWTEEQVSKWQATGSERSPSLPKAMLVFIQSRFFVEAPNYEGV